MSPQSHQSSVEDLGLELLEALATDGTMAAGGAATSMKRRLERGIVVRSSSCFASSTPGSVRPGRLLRGSRGALRLHGTRKRQPLHRGTGQVGGAGSALAMGQLSEAGQAQ